LGSNACARGRVVVEVPWEGEDKTWKPLDNLEWDVLDMVREWWEAKYVH